MNAQELTDLKNRCKAAVTYGRVVANASAYAAELEAEAGPVAMDDGLVKHSAAHLVALIEKVEAVREGTATKSEAVDPEEITLVEPPKETKRKSKGKKAKKEAAEASEGEPESEGSEEDAGGADEGDGEPDKTESDA